MSVAYQLWSDNFDGELLSTEAYNEVLCTMSTGDYCVHRSRLVKVKDLDPHVDVLCFNKDEYVWYSVLACQLPK
jgi:hypothetical protein